MGNIFGLFRDVKEDEENISPSSLYQSYIESQNKLLSQRIESLQKQIDVDKNNIVTKDELLKYFGQLSDKIDKNSDGVITQNELKSYVNQQLMVSQDEVVKWKNAYEKLYDQYEKLKTDFDNLEHDYVNNNHTNIIEKENRETNGGSYISTDALKDYIQHEILDTDANLSLIPDPIERKIYLTLFKTVMKSLLEGLVRTTSVDIANHRWTSSINPIPMDERKTSHKNH